MRELTDGVWIEDASFKVGGVDLRGRMTVLTDGDGGLVLHSPTRIDDALAEEVRALGEVRWIVAPNLFHHLFANRTKDRWPNARLLAAPGLREKVPELKVDAVLDVAPPEWDGAIAIEPIAGMPKLNEVALIHRASRTLVVGDFVFNMVSGDWWTRSCLRLVGSFGPTRQTRVVRFAMKDEAAVHRSAEALLAHDFDALVMCHGDALASGGREALRGACAWLGELG